jgi:hypothetical protein
MIPGTSQVTDAMVRPIGLVCRPQMWPFLSSSDDLEGYANESDDKTSDTEGCPDYLVVGPP